MINRTIVVLVGTSCSIRRLISAAEIAVNTGTDSVGCIDRIGFDCCKFTSELFTADYTNFSCLFGCTEVKAWVFSLLYHKSHPN